jgi:preprotein translocase subunit YajC
MTNYFTLLQSQGSAQGMQMIMLVGIVAVFYFFMIRPQTKKAKEAKNFQSNLQKGDKVVTIAGIHGKIDKVNEDNTLQLEVSPGSYLRIEKSAISMEWSKQLNGAASAEKK